MNPLPWFGALLLALVSVLAPPPQDPVQQDPRKAPEEVAGPHSCTTVGCHGDLATGRSVHRPVQNNKCGACHGQENPKKHLFKAVPGGAETCNECHQLPERPVQHEPVAAGRCAHCHEPHRSESPKLLRASSKRDACAECHEQAEGMGRQFVHGPITAGACTLCHSPHSSYHPHLFKRKGPEICLGCHEEMEQNLMDSEHWHQPVSEDCTACHNPHASDHPHHLKDREQVLCMDCHKDKKEEIDNATVFHEALTTEGGCKNCHSTHAGRFPKLLDKPVIELCLDCHDQPLKRQDGTVVRAMGRELADSKYLHGPIREGDCSGCHNPHGSKNFSLLREQYPERFYTPFDVDKYNLCFGCHDPRMFTEERTETLTYFRNGEQNLHFLHVNMETKGRTCRACHVTHGSNLPNHIATTVPFGGWEIPIRYQKNGRGGSCAPGCHDPKSYDPVQALPDFKKRTGR